MERTIETIKKDIERLYKTAPHIHVNVAMRHPKVIVRNEPAEIIGMYPNFFQIEERESGYLRRHTLQYNDVLMGRVEILELTGSAE